MKRSLSFFFIISLLALAKVANAQTASSADSTNLKAYTGTYTFASDSPIRKFTVTTDKGELYGEADGYGRNKLVKQTKADTYQSTSSYGSVITFRRDTTAKAVTGSTMAIQGAELIAQKDKL